MTDIIKHTASRFGQSEEHVLQEIQAAIDAAWLSEDPAVQILQQHFFPEGKPSPGEFIFTVASRVQTL